MIETRLSHYRLLEQIGAGGMGVVYRARDEHLDRDVAVKVLPAGALADDATRQRFRREAHALSRLNHPHIATVFDFDSQDGVDFLVMELVPGVSLAERLASGPLPEAEVCAIGAQIADALEAAHEQGIVHRDLKPGNVVLTKKGQVKVLDFGLARLMRPREGLDRSKSLTEAEVAVGTVAYMAPEQLLGQKVDARADLYSLGVVLYELATGRSPYREKIPTALIYEIMNQPVAAPREITPQLSPRLETIILNCLEKDPERRYASARALADDLRSSAPVARRGRATHRLQFTAGAAMIIVLTLVGLFDAGGLRSRLIGAGRIQSLAVLPLEDLSGDSTQTYFADGMTEELINRLAQIAALKVTSRSSAMTYRNSRLGVPEIARRLKVDAVIEGSVRRYGESVRIAVQLVRAATDKNIWSSSYERDAGDVFALQSDVAQSIARQIRIAVTPQERTRLAASRRVDPAAHEEYLKGRYYFGEFTKAGFLKSLEHYQEAIALDPGFALAYAGIADTYSGMSSTYMPPDSAIPLVVASTTKALQLDPELPEAYTARGYVKAFYDWRWRDAERDFQHAIELTPGSAWAHAEYGYLLAVNGRFDAAIAEFGKAHEIDPLSTLISSMQLWPLNMGRRYDQAITAAQRMIREDSTAAWNALGILGQVYTHKREFDKAIAAAREYRRILRDSTPEVFPLIHAMQGNRAQALRELDQLLQRHDRDPYSIAMIYGALGMRDEAFAWLEKDMQARRESVIWLKVDPDADPLRSDPRFRGLLRRLGFAT